MPEPRDEYNLADLCRTLDVTPRTVRYYVAQGLLPPPAGAGQAARYGGRHVARLRLIRQLQRQHMPLADIRARLAVLTDDDIRGLVETPSTAPAADESALDYIRAILGSVSPALRAPSAQVPVPPTQAQRRAYESLAPAPLAPPPSSAPAVRAGRLAAVVGPLPPTGPDAAPGAPVPPEATASPSVPQPGGPDTAHSSDVPVTMAIATPPSDAGDARRDGPVTETAPVSIVAGWEASTLDQSPLRSQWDRLILAPDVELHVRRPSSRTQNRRIERLIAIARELLEED